MSVHPVAPLEVHRPAPGPEAIIEAVSSLPTRFGEFQVVAFSNSQDDREHVALVRGDVEDALDVPVRLHSECLTGDVLASLRCDCRDQLERALELLAAEERGVLLYLRQEGRGIGLTNKLKAYELQERLGLDTVDANLALGFRDDERRYEVAVAMLRVLGVRSVALLTNNPSKLDQLAALGMPTRRIPHAMPPGTHNRRYLRTKATRSGHLLGLPTAESVR